MLLLQRVRSFLFSLNRVVGALNDFVDTFPFSQSLNLLSGTVSKNRTGCARHYPFTSLPITHEILLLNYEKKGIDLLVKTFVTNHQIPINYR